MQISNINMVLPETRCSFRGETDNVQRRRRYRNPENVEAYREVNTPQTDAYRGRQEKQQSHKFRNALLIGLAGVTAGTVAGNVATTNELKTRAMQNPIPVVSKLSGAPQDLIYEWQINGMTVYPEVLKQPVVSDVSNFTSEQLQNIQTAQNKLADVYYNGNNGQFYLVLKKDTDIKEIKATFGLSLSNDGSIEKLNYLYNKPTIGADLNSAMLKEGEIVRFASSEAGVKENFYGALLVEALK